MLLRQAQTSECGGPLLLLRVDIINNTHARIRTRAHRVRYQVNNKAEETKQPLSGWSFEG